MSNIDHIRIAALKLAAESGTDPRTTTKALLHGPGSVRTTAARLAIQRAAERLGIKLPSEARSA